MLNPGHLPHLALLASPQFHAAAVELSRALLNLEHKLSVIWSAKSACTTVYTWFALISGFADELGRDGRGPHKHRTSVYLNSDLYRRSLAADPARFRTLRVIRDPYTRAASSYRHALRFPRLRPDHRPGEDGEKTRPPGLSFQEFLAMLERLDIARANPHFRPQFSALEKVRKPDHVINISKSDLLEELRRVEEMWSLPRSGLQSLRWFMEREEGRRAGDLRMDGRNLDRVRFNVPAAAGKRPFPAYDQLLTPAARARIEKIYAVDFEAYRAHL